MQTETAVVMIVGIVALTIVRLIVALVGRDFAADHDHPTAHPSDPHTPRPQVRRGTGRESHLLYFEPATVRSAEPAAPAEPVVPLPSQPYGDVPQAS
jgi:hypothetical protein